MKVSKSKIRQLINESFDNILKEQEMSDFDKRRAEMEARFGSMGSSSSFGSDFDRSVKNPSSETMEYFGIRMWRGELMGLEMKSNKNAEAVNELVAALEQARRDYPTLDSLPTEKRGPGDVSLSLTLNRPLSWNGKYGDPDAPAWFKALYKTWQPVSERYVAPEPPETLDLDWQKDYWTSTWRGGYRNLMLQSISKTM